MASDRVCGCNVVTAAGIVCSLQLIILLLSLSSSGLILDRYRTWKAVEPRGAVNASEAAEYEAANKTLRTTANHWAEAVVELGMAWYVAFCTFWLFSLLIICLSFKYYRPVFVIPNFTALVVGLIMHLFAFGILLGRLLSVSKSYQTDEFEESIMVFCCGLYLFVFLTTLCFIIFILKYHSYLRARYGHQVPKFINSRNPRNTTGYTEDY